MYIYDILILYKNQKIMFLLVIFQSHFKYIFFQNIWKNKLKLKLLYNVASFVINSYVVLQNMIKIKFYINFIQKLI